MSSKLNISFNPFSIFRPSKVAQKILDDLDKYPLNDWDWFRGGIYKNTNLAYEIYQDFCGVYRVWNLQLGYFDTARIDYKCKNQIKAAEKLARDMAEDKVISQILKS